MTYNPSVQAAAKAEIERVIGADRLPTYADRASLPYVEAVYKEVLRWQPVAPMGVPHKYAAKLDDEYQGALVLHPNGPICQLSPATGVRIPAGATIVANEWAMLRAQGFMKTPIHSTLAGTWVRGEHLTQRTSPSGLADGW